MTKPKDQEPAGSEDAEPTENDANSTADASSQPTKESSNEASEDSSAADNPDDDLPEWEPLSPEIVEDEAIRGDFMLRWAIVLLAFLLGCRQISETVTLVRVRTGEYLTANGILPPANDVFSYTATERPWVNLAWMFDIVIAGVHGIGGATGLTLFSALAAAAIFYLLHAIGRRETPTWWTSVCACIALMMVQLQFTALPQVITLLGTAWVLHSLFSWSQTGKRATLGCLVISLAVWSNLDPRAFVGWFILLSYCAGTSLSRKAKRNDHHADASMNDLMMATAAGFVALMINPFGWHAILSPMQLYGVEIPALIGYAGQLSLPDRIQLVSLLDSSFWNHLNQHTVAGLLIVAAAIATSLMNRARLDFGLAVALVATVSLSIVCSHELGAAALVACVLASLNGQDWYRANCRQEYSIDTFEVLWSRAGRAVTVLAIAGIAFLAISGRLMGPEGRRVGVGFSPSFAAILDSSANELDALPDGRLFTFRLDHGDLLLWHGTPTFVDSRVGVFSGDGDDDILQIHNTARNALRGAAADPTTDDSQPTSKGIGNRELWKAPFDRFQVNLVTPRMWGRDPDYISYVRLAMSPDWDVVSLGATTAVFQRTELNASDVPRTGPARGLFRKIAFDDCRVNTDVPPRYEWPRAASTYQQFLSLPDQPASSFAVRARHELAHLSLLQLGTDDALGLAVLTIRDAMAGMAEEPDNPYACRILGDAYGVLERIESMALARYELPRPTQQRFYQRLFAYHQALTLDPDNVEILSSIADLYFSGGQSDLALEMIERALEVIGNQPGVNDQTRQLKTRLNQVKDQIAPGIETTKSRVRELLTQENVDIAQVAKIVRRGGFPKQALELLERDRMSLAGNPSAELQLAFLLVDAGRFQEASAIFASFEEASRAQGSSFIMPLPAVLQACWLDMALGDHETVTQRCSQRISEMQKAATEAMMSTLPFSMPVPQFVGESNIWPANQTLIASRVMLTTAGEIAVLQWTLAMSQIEAGKCAEATATMNDLLEAFPESNFRPMVTMWLSAMTGEEFSAEPPKPTPSTLFHDDSDIIGR